MRFQNKSILITGGGTGLGRGAALGLAHEGGTVGLMGRRLDKLEAVAAEVGQAGGTAVVLHGDVTQQEDVERCVQTLLAEAGGIDILINNAGGGGIRMDLHEIPDDHWYRIIESNLTGTFRMCRMVIPHFLEKGQGNIINVASVGGMRVRPKASAYDGAKAGVIMLSKCIAFDYATRNIRCNVIAPGVILTEVNDKNLSEWGPEVREEFRKRQPVGRFGEVNEVTAAMLFYASDDAPFITGSVLTVDGAASV